jgi:uncharacterized protein DUF3310
MGLFEEIAEDNGFSAACEMLREAVRQTPDLFVLVSDPKPGEERAVEVYQVGTSKTLANLWAYTGPYATVWTARLASDSPAARRHFVSAPDAAAFIIRELHATPKAPLPAEEPDAQPATPAPEWWEADGDTVGELFVNAVEGHDPVVQPHYYARFTIEPATFIAANKLPFDVGSIIKYVCRFDAKNGRQDVEKAKRFCEMLLERIDREARVDAGESAADVWKEML